MLEHKHAPDKSKLLLLEIGFRTRELIKHSVLLVPDPLTKYTAYPSNKTMNIECSC